MRIPLVLIALALIVGGCSNQPANNTTSPVESAAAASSPGTAAEPTPATVDAKTVIEAIGKAELSLTGISVQDEDTDPNNLLGRPNGYTSRSSADLPGGDKNAEKYSVDRGLVVEGFATAEDAKRRSSYIQGLQKDNPILGTEWHYSAGRGTALVRVSGKVKPSLAKKIEAALADM
jgi:hypothetical protein